MSCQSSYFDKHFMRLSLYPLEKGQKDHVVFGFRSWLIGIFFRWTTTTLLVIVRMNHHHLPMTNICQELVKLLRSKQTVRVRSYLYRIFNRSMVRIRCEYSEKYGENTTANHRSRLQRNMVSIRPFAYKMRWLNGRLRLDYVYLRSTPSYH